MRGALWVISLWLWAGPLAALECNQETYLGARYTVCEFNMADDDLRLFHKDPAGRAFGQFNALRQHLDTQGFALRFAMNAGMFHADLAPVGHYVEGGRETMRVIANAGPGNFGLLPNGILCLSDGRADVIETRRFQREGPTCRDATQSGPMLVIDGALHPRFLVNSTSRKIRNGVGTGASGQRAVFVIADTPVTPHAFGSFFRDALHLPQALYLDGGSAARLYAPTLGRHDPGRAVGPMVGVIEAVN